MITLEEVKWNIEQLKYKADNLEDLVEELNNDIICCFEDFEIDGISEVITTLESNLRLHELYEAYINKADSETITFAIVIQDSFYKVKIY